MKINRVLTAIWGAVFGVGAAVTALGVIVPAPNPLDFNATDPNIYEIQTINGPAYITSEFKPFVDGSSEGTGVLDPFLSIQESPTEQGFNIDQGNLDTKRNGQFTRTQRVSDFITITINGASYISFVIDVNEPNNASSIVSLDALRLYSSDGSQVNPLQTLGDLNTSATLQFDLFDIMTDLVIRYDDLNSGSGEGDIALLIPLAAFVGVSGNDYFYMYQAWGAADGNFDANAGFEETKFQAVIIPETNAIVPLLAVLGVVLAGPFVRRCFHP